MARDVAATIQKKKEKECFSECQFGGISAMTLEYFFFNEV